MSEIRTLTLADIRSNSDLMKSGAEPGDTYTIDEDGTVNVNRIFNLENEEVELGVVLTEKMLEDQPVLKERGLEPGDRYLPDQDKFIKTGTDSAWEQFFYGYQETPGLTENLVDILESYASVGEIDLFTDDEVIGYTPPEELYGKGFEQADNETRRSMIRRAKERQLLDKYGRFFNPKPDSIARTAGEFAGSLVDPTTFIPFVGPAARAATVGTILARVGANIGIGGSLGAAYSVTDDLAAGQDIDVDKALLSGAIAAGGTGALIGVGKGVSKLKDRSANKIIDKADEILARNIASGMETNAALANTQKEIMSRSGMPIERAMERTGRKVRMPGSQSTAHRKLVNAAQDQTVSRFYSKPIDEIFGSLSTRIGNISQPVLRRLRVFEFDSRVQTVKTLNKVEPFLKSLSKIKGAQKKNLSMHLANGRFDEAANVMPPAMKKQFTEVRKVLEKLHTKMNEEGIPVAKIQNYFPRKIKRNGYDKLLNHWGKEKQGLINKKIGEEALKKGYEKKNTPVDRRDEIANLVFRGYHNVESPKLGIQKKRSVEDVTPDILEFYTSPEEALQMYVRNSVNSIARAKFFNKGHKKELWSGSYDDASIGKTVERELKNLSPDQENELISLIQSRMMGGEQTPNYAVGILRDLGYMGTIANPISAITQLGDLGVSGALHQFRNTIASMFGTKNIKMIDAGLEDVGQEFADVRWSSNQLRKLFKISGFRAIDRLGKETSMNAALRKNIKLLKTAKAADKLFYDKSTGRMITLGEKQFRAKWGKFYKGDIDQIIGEFKVAGKGGEIGEAVKFHAFNELSDMQPISMLEMPQKYLDHPNGRILYALKTFTLKQIDVVRRNVVQEWKAGNKGTAIKNAGLLAAYLSAANVGTGAIKDILLLRDPGLDNIPDKSLWALLGVYGFNRYGAEKYLKDGKLTEWAANTVAPAAPMIDAITGLTAQSFKDDPNAGRYLRAVPLVGPMFYNWFGGGAEKYNERLDKERRN